MAKLHPLLEPYIPTSDDPFDSVKAAHLLSRAAFGGTPDEIAEVQKLGPEAAIDMLMDFPDARAEEISQTDLPDLSSIEGYPKSFQELRKLAAGKTQEERKALQQMLQQANREAVAATIYWWMNRFAYGPYPLHEKLTFFWHGHFTTSAKDERAAALMWNQNETIRSFAAGNFRKFVKAISRDPAMLDYLNNTQNRKQKPNENYARELMELFTLGIGNYGENDIKEAARAFTGWTHEDGEYKFRKYDHDEGQKVFFGKRGNFNGDDIADIIFMHPACAPYITGKMFKWFVYEELDSGLAESLGNILKENDWDLRPLIRAMFTSKAFYSYRAIGSQIKSPVQLLAGTVKLLNIDMPAPMRLYGSMEQMGQVPLMPPNVKGWPGGRMWINTSTLFVRYNTCVFLAGGNAPMQTLKRAPKAGRVKGRTRDVQGDFTPPVDGPPMALVNYWVKRLIQRPIAEEKKQVLLDAVGSNASEDSVRQMIQLIVSMPEYQLC
jgi:hypothetical protein